MKRFVLWMSAIAAAAAAGSAATAQAEHHTLAGRIAYNRAQQYAWHGSYYHSAWGMPVALVVPPNAESQVHWGWGVGNFQITTIRHQFSRNYPGPSVYDRSQFHPTPYWPAHTNQFGVYYVRGPW